LENVKKIFELSNIYYSYPYEEPVLCDISLSIGLGERICILGANGSGKSTLLKVLAGLIFPQKGSYRAFGDIVNEKSFSSNEFSKSYHKRVGVIFQNSDTQLFCSTVEEEIAFGPLQFGFSRDKLHERVNQVIDLLEIEQLRKKAPFKLSGGEKKKVAIASILVLNPDILILDEPTNGLDPRTQRWLVRMLGSLNNAGKTIVTSTHNLELVREISDRSVVFSEGHNIVLDAPTDEVLSNIELLKNVNLL
jgi:cobalt/nickel transport system ATP-binding protein